jgi:hypothetical protein
MSDLDLIEGADRLEIRSPMRIGLRVLLAVLGLLPLLAPYELLIQVEWETFAHPFFVLAAIVSAGATALSALLLFAAVAGSSSIIVFDKSTGTFSYSAEAPVVKRKRRVHPLADIRSVGVGVREWSDGAPSYYLRVRTNGGSVFDTASSWSRDEVERIRNRIREYLGAHG